MSRLLLAALSLPLAAAALAQENGVPDAPRGGDARSALEARIAQMNPCEPLGTEVAGFSLGVDRVRQVNIHEADIRLRGDGVSFRMNGRLACRGRDEGEAADLAFDVMVSVDGILSRCEVTGSDVSLDNSEGNMSMAFDLAAPVIEGILVSRIEEEARSACTGLAG